MGRIEEALKRVASESVRPEGGRSGQNDEAIFSSPWETDRTTTSNPVQPLHGRKPGAELPRRERQMPPAPPVSMRSGAAVGHELAPSVRLESQLALSWPRPFASDVAGKVVATTGVDPAAVEQYCRLADSLRLVRLERGAKIAMIVSAIGREGRTLTAVNLAFSLSESQGQRVLLVDADLRHPRIHQLFHVTAGAGLSGALMSTGGALPIVGLTAGVALLPGGRPQQDPTPLLESGRMREVLAEACRSYDWVILDTPPATVVPDAGLLAREVDVAVLVVEAGMTPRHLVEQAVELFGRDRLVGVVLNRVEDVAMATAEAERPPHPSLSRSVVDRSKPVLAD